MTTLHSRRLRLGAGLVLGLLGVGLAIAGAWIPIKAQVAQVLLHRSWERALAGEAQPPPWPWADTWPVARLSFPDGRRVVVLAGTHGEALAFGPGHLTGSAPPGAVGNTVLAAHRDTHFRNLRDLAPGDPIRVEAPDGGRTVYRVRSARVVDRTDVGVLRAGTGRALTLVTCYPFGAVDPGGPLRYVVRAEAEPSDLATSRPAGG